MGKNLKESYASTLEEIIDNTDTNLFAETTVDNVYQEAQLQNRPHFQFIIEDLLLPGSRVEGLSNLFELHEFAKGGKSALILSAHYSNFDVPTLYTLLKREGERSEKVFDDIIFIAGRKLTEKCKYVRSLAEMFTRVVISAKVPNMTKAEIQKAMAINKTSQKIINDLKHSGKIFLLYPTGTRIRYNSPQTHRGIREVYNYIRKFDYFLCCGIKGNLLPASDDVPMIEEFPKNDKVIMKFGRVRNVESYLNRLEKKIERTNGSEDIDKKQWVIDKLMDEIYSLGEDPRSKISSMTSLASKIESTKEKITSFSFKDAIKNFVNNSRDNS
jgi:glycerol-3-phosphate O-acyltransferase